MWHQSKVVGQIKCLPSDYHKLTFDVIRYAMVKMTRFLKVTIWGNSELCVTVCELC